MRQSHTMLWQTLWQNRMVSGKLWSEWQDLNLRPLVPNEAPQASTHQGDLHSYLCYLCRYAAFFGRPPRTQKSQLIVGKVTENDKRIFRCVTGRYLPHFVRSQNRLLFVN